MTNLFPLLFVFFWSSAFVSGQIIVQSASPFASLSLRFIIVAFGFIIFAFSNFGGTIVLGILTSVILFVAMITNLTLLPSIILHFYKK